MAAQSTQVLVTGGTGYIGGWVIVALLRKGYKVRTSVRDLKREAGLRQMLHGAVDFKDSQLQVVQADLQDDSGWPKAVAGCGYVIHVASPTLRNAPESEAAMISAARDGVLRVLIASRDAHVRRVVLTSAFGAIGYGHPPRKTPFTEKDWTNVDADIAPYQRSKTLAERAAWDFIKKESKGLELAAVHPVAVCGPVLGNDDPPSLRTIRTMLEGKIPVCPPFATSWVDVRDVADLHLLAMTSPKANGQRLLASAGKSLKVIDIARILHKHLGAQASKAPTREMPLPIARFLSRFDTPMRPLRTQLGKNFDATSAKAEKLLGWKPRPAEDSIVETAKSLIAHKLV